MTNILLIDDEEQVVSLEKEILEHLGYNVTAQTSSKKAFETFRMQPEEFDLVITDYGLPEVNGIHLAGMLADIRPDIPIIFITGFNGNIPENLRRSGIREWIMKPVRVHELGMIVKKVLNKKSKGV